MIRTLLGTVVAVTVLVAAPVAAESYAGNRLADSVRSAVGVLAPNGTVTDVEPHGRPFLAALAEGEVSSAYVSVQSSGSTTQVIVQRLHRATGKVDRVLWFPRVASHPGLAPVFTPSGAHTPRGTVILDGELAEVTYAARVVASTVRLAPTDVTVASRTWAGDDIPPAWRDLLTPPLIELPTTRPLVVRAVSVGEQDITVELQMDDVETEPAPETRTTVPS